MVRLEVTPEVRRVGVLLPDQRLAKAAPRDAANCIRRRTPDPRSRRRPAVALDRREEVPDHGVLHSRRVHPACDPGRPTVDPAL